MNDFVQTQPIAGKWYVGQDETGDQTQQFTTYFADHLLHGPFDTENTANEWMNRQTENVNNVYVRQFHGEFSTNA